MTLEDDLEIPDAWTHYGLDGETDLLIRQYHHDAELVIATNQYFGGQQRYYTHHIDPYGNAETADNGLGPDGREKQRKLVQDHLENPTRY